MVRKPRENPSVKMGFYLSSVAVKLAPPIDKSCSKSVPFNELCSY